MKPIYARKETNKGTRKVMLDMAFLVTHKQIRLPKYYMEEGLYLPYYANGDKSKVEKFFLSKENAKKEDDHFYYFDFRFKPAQVEDITT